jgi:hypothetical protein
LLQLLLLVLEGLLGNEELAPHLVVSANGGGKEAFHMVEAVLLGMGPLDFRVVLKDLQEQGRRRSMRWWCQKARSGDVSNIHVSCSRARAGMMLLE